MSDFASSLISAHAEAVGAWNNVTVTNITIMRSTVVLTINPVAAEQLHEPSVTVSGTIDTSGYKVWGNGVGATNHGDGTWTATDVPMTAGGTAVLQARAIPNSDNGGEGPGGSSGTNASDQNPGNPSSTQSQTAEAQTDKPYRFYVSSCEHSFS